jgi:hypothetical protein
MSSKIESPGTRNATVADESAAGAWDPYEVWLNRVKKPRDEQALMNQTTEVVSPDLSDTARLRALTLSLAR